MSQQYETDGNNRACDAVAADGVHVHHNELPCTVAAIRYIYLHFLMPTAVQYA